MRTYKILLIFRKFSIYSEIKNVAYLLSYELIYLIWFKNNLVKKKRR